MTNQQLGRSAVEARTRMVVIWDLPTRVFKWSLVVAVLVAFLFSSSHPRGSLFLVHVGCGYTVALLLLFRFVWGFIGGQYARFHSFVRGWKRVRAYGLGLLRFDPPRVVGHNPVGGWMIVALLVTLSVVVLTGLVAEGRTGGAGQLSHALPASAVAIVGNIHAWLGFLIMWLAGLHVAGVLFESLLHRENLIRTMLTGRKRVVGQDKVDVRGVSLWRVVPLVIVLAIMGIWLAAGTRAPPMRPNSRITTQ